MALHPFVLALLANAMSAHVDLNDVASIHVTRAFQPIWPADAPTEFDVVLTKCSGARVEMSSLGSATLDIRTDTK